MTKLAVDIIKMDEQILYGLWKKSNDKTISRDIDTLSEAYHSAVALSQGSVLPYFVLSKNYDEKTKNFELFIGSTFEHESLQNLLLPAGEYAKITVRPKLGLLWGASIGQAKRYFYTKWLPESGYQSLNMEYELHTERSKGNHPAIDIIFAIQQEIK
ncbi:GyrI-like domain-containing protein [Anaerovorax odorimutans]|uniref:GyrI-like domain-containing protein n=1 Tax=Anaerovorax odorimutans TaxID=109327 RepID=A0ABT1RSD4_9FIRM|nr:GyrI-like domain-containing protein [Anaerovorax odorimutans]MCQ4638114.1 GyrI-like domain-containing protein [Anaerovorax odorimutans]